MGKKLVCAAILPGTGRDPLLILSKQRGAILDERVEADGAGGPE